MKLIYLTVDGREIIENTRINSGRRLLEEPDGYHPITNDSVWHDTKKRHNTRMLVIDGVTPLLGADMTHADLETTFNESIVEEVSYRKMPVSKMWARAFARLGEWVIKYSPILIMGAIIIWALYNSMIGGF